MFMVIIVCLGAIMFFLYVSHNKKEQERKAEEERKKARSEAEHKAKVRQSIDDANNQLRILCDEVKALRAKADRTNDSEDAKLERENAEKKAVSLLHSLDIAQKTSSKNNIGSQSAESVLRHLNCTLKEVSQGLPELSLCVEKAEALRYAEKSRVPYISDCRCVFPGFPPIDYNVAKKVGFVLNDSPNTSYQMLFVPSNRTKIKYPVEGRSNLRGASEVPFCQRILSLNIAQGFYDNLSLVLNSNVTYEPDLAYIDVSKGIFIDIEIDESYVRTNGTTQAIHCKGTDNVRNQFFTDRGWIVMRFAEEQIVKYPLECVKQIFEFIIRLNPTVTMPGCLKSVGNLPTVATWDSASAMRMANNKEREKLLGVSSFKDGVAISRVIKDYPAGIIMEKDLRSAVKAATIAARKKQQEEAEEKARLELERKRIAEEQRRKEAEVLNRQREEHHQQQAEAMKRQEEQRKREAMAAERSKVKTNSAPTSTPSSRGYA